MLWLLSIDSTYGKQIHRHKTQLVQHTRLVDGCSFTPTSVTYRPLLFYSASLQCKPTTHCAHLRGEHPFFVYVYSAQRDLCTPAFSTPTQNKQTLSSSVASTDLFSFLFFSMAKLGMHSMGRSSHTHWFDFKTVHQISLIANLCMSPDECSYFYFLIWSSWEIIGVRPLGSVLPYPITASGGSTDLFQQCTVVLRCQQGSAFCFEHSKAIK